MLTYYIYKNGWTSRENIKVYFPDFLIYYFLIEDKNVVLFKNIIIEEIINNAVFNLNFNYTINYIIH